MWVSGYSTRDSIWQSADMDIIFQKGATQLVTGLLSWKIGTALAPPWHDQDPELNSGRMGWHFATAGFSLVQVAGVSACWSLCKIRRLK